MFDKFNIHQKHSILVALMLIILTLGVYWPVQDYEFVNYDDNLYVTENYLTQSGLTYQGIIKTFTDVHIGHWHPLTLMSHMLDWQLFGYNAGGHHWTSVIIHVVNTILLFILFKNLTGAIWRSAFVAVLFAIHPINVESVAWVAERKNVLSTFFWILTMLFYVWYVKKPNWKYYLPVLISFALGLMCKPMLVTLPFVLLLLDYWPLNRIQINLQNEDQPGTVPLIFVKRRKVSFLILEKFPLFFLTAISVGITIYAAQSARAIASLEATTFTQRVNNVIFSYVLYLKKIFWPTDLTVFYPHFNIPIWQIFLSGIFLIVITIIIYKYFRKYPYLPVGWFWYLGTLVPVIGIVQAGSQTMADRYAYVPFIGLFVIIAWGTEQVVSKIISLKKLIIFVSVLIIVMFTLATYNQIKLWTNTVTLFEDALKKNPNNHVAYNILGLDAAGKNNNEKALMNYYMAQKINPEFDPAYNNAGIILIRIGRRYEAFNNFERAIRLNKFSAEAYYNIGLFFLEDNNLDKSITYFIKVIEIRPDYVEAHNNLGIALIKKGKIRDGILQFKLALQLNPNYKDAARNLQIALEMNKKSKNDGISP